MSTIVRGPTVVREQVMALYEHRFPDALQVARDAWGLTVKELPVPMLYDRMEAENVDGSVVPMLCMSVGRSREYTRVDVEPGAEECYRVRYDCRLFAWLKRMERRPTLESRDDYATVLTSVLLANQGLDGGGAFRLLEETLEVTYSDAAKVRGDRYVAGCSVGFSVFHTETVRRVPLGSAAEIGVEATVLPGHPGV